jgi:hypothetical protein
LPASKRKHNVRDQEKGPLKSGPKFREETPKKGGSTATPIAVLHCIKLLIAHTLSKRG